MPRRPVLATASVLAATALLATACALPPPEDRDDRAQPGRGGREAPAARAPSRRPGPTLITGASVRVVMNDRFRYRPAEIMVHAGRTVTFAVTNAGKVPHEFILGDRATQLDHERQMQTAAEDGGHAHHHGSHTTASAPGALTVAPGETRRLTWTFQEPGVVLYGCHVLGHWAAGMKGTIVVLGPGAGRR